MVARSFPRTGLHVLLEGCFMCTIGFSLLGQMPSNIPKHVLCWFQKLMVSQVLALQAISHVKLLPSTSSHHWHAVRLPDSLQCVYTICIRNAVGMGSERGHMEKL